MACKKECFEATVNVCSDITIRAGFLANYPFYYILLLRNNHRIQRSATTNLEGELVIDQDDLPPGLFAIEQVVGIELRDGNNYLQKIFFQFGGEIYGCILADIQRINVAPGDTSELNVIQFVDSNTPENAALIFMTDTNFQIQQSANDVLEYISLSNANPFTVKIGTTLGGNEITEQYVTDGNVISLLYHSPAAETIYVSGIPANTLVKIKKS